MPEALTFALRGPFRALAADGMAIEGLSRRGQAILAALAVAPEFTLTRTALATLIWGDRGEDQARASLRQELSVLRRLLPEGVLVADRTAVRLEGCGTDTGNAGTFLELPEIGSPPFEDWLRDSRASLAETWSAGVLAAGEAALAAGRGAEGEEQARRVLAGDPLNEAAMGLLLRAAGKSGQKAAALKAFEAFRGALRRELDTVPSGETEALAEALRKPGVVAAVAPVPQGTDFNTPSLAIMPFDEIGGNRADMFADGIVEEITGALSRVHEFHVIARQSAYALRDSGLDVPQLAARLGADYLVEGTLQRAGARVRLSVQLVAGEDGHTLWSARFDDHVDDLFGLQDRIAAQVAGQLSPSLRQAEIARVHQVPQEHRSAYAQVLSALPHFWKHKRDENLMAMRHLDRALELVPGYGPALAYKAWALAQMAAYIWSDDPERDRREAIALARRAAALTSDHSPSLVALGAALSMTMAGQTDARSYIDRALAIDPNNAWGWMRRGWMEVYDRHHEEARASFEKAEALSPLDPFRFNMILGRAAIESRAGGDPEQAIRLIREAMTLAPGMTWAYRLLAVALQKTGRTDEAKDAMKALIESYPNLTFKVLDASLPPSRNPDIVSQYQLLKELGLRES